MPVRLSKMGIVKKATLTHLGVKYLLKTKGAYVRASPMQVILVWKSGLGAIISCSTIFTEAELLRRSLLLAHCTLEGSEIQDGFSVQPPIYAGFTQRQAPLCSVGLTLK